MTTTKPALPEPFDWCYEWDGPYGTRKFSAASHNGMKPARSVPIYRPDQMRAYAGQCTAAAQARIVELKGALRAIAEGCSFPADAVQRAVRDRARAALASTSGAEPVNVHGPEHLAPKPAEGLEFDARGVLVPSAPPICWRDWPLRTLNFKPKAVAPVVDRSVSQCTTACARQTATTFIETAMSDTPNTEELIARLAAHIRMMAPHQREREAGKLIVGAKFALEAQAAELEQYKTAFAEQGRAQAIDLALLKELHEAELARVRAERDTYKWHWEQASKQPEWNVPEPMTLLSDSDLLAVLQGWREFDKPEEFQGISYGAMRSALAAYHKALIAAAPPPPAQPAPPSADARDAARLDFLEGDAMTRVFKIGKTWYWKHAYGQPHRKAKSLRVAIDSAMASNQEPKAHWACESERRAAIDAAAGKEST